MRTVPLWKWLTVLFSVILVFYYLYPSIQWYSYPPDIRNAADPKTASILEIDAKLAEIRSATGEARSETEIRALETERQSETDKLHRLRLAALPLGLDLAGGMHVVLEVQAASGTATVSKTGQEEESLLDQALTVYRARIDKLGLTEPVVEKQPPRRILIQIPGVKNPDDVLRILRATARLEFHLASADTLLAKAVDAVVRTNPALQDRIRLQSGSPAVEVAEEDVASTSRAVQLARLQVPPGYQFMWGPLEVKTDTGARYRNLYLIEDKPQMGGDRLTRAFVSYQTTIVTQPIVSLEFDREGTAQFARVTTEHVQKNLAIVLDGLVYSAPVIDQPIRNGAAIIKGNFTTQEAASLAVVLEAGALKTDVRIIENRSIGPSLGMDSIIQGFRAASWGLAVTVVFMVAYYALAGVFANIALLLNLFLLVAAMAMLHASLTLPGIAGIILTIGMSVDANVLVFERIREEIKGRTGGSALAGIERGYSRALSAILDGNITTILTALILMQYGTGPIKGFAVSLTVGLMISLFTALFVTRVFQDWWAIGKKNEDLSVGSLRFMEGTQVDFIKIAPPFVIASILIIVTTMGYTLTHWSNVRGLELTGGTMVRLKFDQAVSSDTLRGQLSSDLKLDSAQIQEIGASSQEFIIRLKKGTQIPAEQQVVQVIPDDGSAGTRMEPGVVRSRADEPEVDLGNFIVAGLAKLNPANRTEISGLESFAASFGGEMALKGILIVVLSWVAILIYVSVRFQFAYAFAAVVALVHDVLISLGCLGFCHVFGMQRELNLSVIAALLTIIGYSTNDTIVIFDRIRENRRGTQQALRTIINTSINQTLSRTIITSLTVLIVVLLLFLFGGDVINDFAFTLLVGVIAGSYSTIFIAGYILYHWHGRRETLRSKA
jgi:SecD/SecF fusion protein